MSGEIFVVGASRSGTNLVRALLNAHSMLWVSGETHYFDDLRPRLTGSGTAPLTGEDRERCERYFLALSHRAFGQAGDADESRLDRDELRALAQELGGTGDAYFEALCRLRAKRHGRERWGEKTPRHVYRIDDLLTAFPEAKVVCLVRDPRAVVASYKDWHGAAARRGVTESTELEADRERSRRSYNPVLMSLLWRGVVRASFAALERHGPERVRIQRFERLAAAPEAEVRELCALARARLRARPARDPGRQQLVRDDRRRGLERAGRALARAALGDRGRDRAVGHRGTDGRARLRQGRRRGLAASAGVGVGGDSRRGGESRCA